MNSAEEFDVASKSVLASGPSTHELLLELCVRFAPARAGGLSCVVEWRVRAGGGVERFQLSIGQGGCELIAPRRQARVALDLSQEDLTALLDGRVTGAELFAHQRLVISGDVLLAARLPGVFPTRLSHAMNGADYRGD